MKCAADTWSSPDQRGVHDASPRPTSPASVCNLTSKNGEVSCVPPRPDLIANSGLIGTRTGIVSTDVIFTRGLPLAMPHVHRVLKAIPEEESVNPQRDRDEQEPPEAIVLPAAVAPPLLLGQRGVPRIPDDAGRLLLRRRLGQERYDDDRDHAIDPIDERPVAVGGAVLAQRRNVWQQQELPDQAEG